MDGHVRLWVHEVLRGFGDRFIDDMDRSWMLTQLRESTTDGIDRGVDFDWLVQQRYYMKVNPDKAEPQTDMLMIITNNLLRYDFECIGNFSRLVVIALATGLCICSIGRLLRTKRARARLRVLRTCLKPRPSASCVG